MLNLLNYKKKAISGSEKQHLATALCNCYLRGGWYKVLSRRRAEVCALPTRKYPAGMRLQTSHRRQGFHRDLASRFSLRCSVRCESSRCESSFLHHIQIHPLVNPIHRNGKRNYFFFYFFFNIHARVSI